MDPMEDEGLKKSVIEQMMGELDDVTANSLRKPKGPVKGVEIAITVTPRDGEGDDAAEDKAMDDACMDSDCEDPEHDHSARDDAKPEDEESGDYISQLLKKLG